ncbi:MAG TPA: putative 4-mercaptohistidine N1-methyltransferase [Luteolibacter sp.]|nr:putative 4-mercaptohistidine N1-methyltransferase [Luteolibacter sp.]
MPDSYETTELLNQYLLFHYGTPSEVLHKGWDWPAGMREALNFPVRTVGYFGRNEVERALDLGCAVGRSTFELARAASKVIGIDYSARFIEAARVLATGVALDYSRLEEGRIRTPLAAVAPAGIHLPRVTFQQGDAMALPEDLGAFDRVHAANLLCRLREPLELLQRLGSLVKPGGELVLATPGTWLEEFTPPENWPTGTTLEWLEETLEDDFELERCHEEPFLIRETARKFQWSRSLVSLWRKRA